MTKKRKNGTRRRSTPRANLDAPVSLTRHQQAGLDQQAEYYKDNFGKWHNANKSLVACSFVLFLKNILCENVAITRLILVYLFDEGFYRKDESVITFIENSFLPVLASWGIFFAMQLWQHKFYPYGSFSKNTPALLKQAYSDPELAERLLSESDDEFREIQSTVFAIAFFSMLRLINFSAKGMPSQSEVNYLTMAFLCYLIYLIPFVSAKMTPKPTFSTKIKDQQIAFLNSITHNQLEWKSKDQLLNFEADFPDRPLRFGNSNIRHKAFASALELALDTVSQKHKVYHDAGGILVKNLNLTKQQVKLVALEFGRLLQIQIEDQEEKQTQIQLFDILSTSRGLASQLCWYLERERQSHKWCCISSPIVAWPAEEQENFRSFLKTILKDETILFTEDRIKILPNAALSEQKTDQLKAYMLQLSQRLHAAASAQRENQAVTVIEKQPEDAPTVSNFLYHFFAGKRRYNPSPLAKEEDVEQFNDKTNNSSKTTLQKFPQYFKVRDYDASEDWRKVLQEEGNVTLPLYHEQKHCGYYILTQTVLQKLQDGGERLLKFVEDNLRYKHGHFIALSKQGKYTHKTGAHYKMRFIEKGNGDSRALFIPQNPDSAHAKDLHVFQFQVAMKHLK